MKAPKRLAETNAIFLAKPSSEPSGYEADEDDSMLQTLAENLVDLCDLVKSLNLSVRLMTTVLRNELRDRAERRETRQ